jgi:hypothetical protein
VIDNLSAALAHIFGRGLERPVLCDDGRLIRVVRAVPDHDGIVSAAFDQIRQAGSGNPAVLIRLVDAIGLLAPWAGAADLKEPLLEQLEAVLSTGEQNISIGPGPESPAGPLEARTWPSIALIRRQKRRDQGSLQAPDEVCPKHPASAGTSQGWLRQQSRRPAPR